MAWVVASARRSRICAIVSVRSTSKLYWRPAKHPKPSSNPNLLIRRGHDHASHRPYQQLRQHNCPHWPCQTALSRSPQAWHGVAAVQSLVGSSISGEATHHAFTATSPSRPCGRRARCSPRGRASVLRDPRWKRLQSRSRTRCGQRNDDPRGGMLSYRRCKYMPPRVGF